jgi:hypothetical protein
MHASLVRKHDLLWAVHATRGSRRRVPYLSSGEHFILQGIRAVGHVAKAVQALLTRNLHVHVHVHVGIHTWHKQEMRPTCRSAKFACIDSRVCTHSCNFVFRHVHVCVRAERCHRTAHSGLEAARIATNSGASL